MKKSAWYHKLWRKKLDSLPVQNNADSAWADMSKLLDEHLPAANTGAGNKLVKPFGTKLISLLGYIVPAAAMVGAGTYLASHTTIISKTKPVKVKPTHYQHKPHEVISNDSINSIQDTLTNPADSSAMFQAQQSDSIRATGNDENAITTPQNNSLPTLSGTPKGNPIAGMNAPVGTTPNQVYTPSALLRKRSGLSGRTTTGSLSHNQHTLKPSANVQPQVTSALFMSSSASSHKTQPRVTGSSVDYTTAQQPTGTNNTAPMAVVGSALTNNTTAQQNSKADAQLRENSKKLKTVASSTKNKTDKNKLPKQSSQSNFHFGLEGGLNTASLGKSFYAGAFGSYQIGKQWLIGTGLRLDAARALSGQHSYNYGTQDSTAFTITDTRKITTLSIPVRLTYQLTDRISLYAEPQLSFVTHQGSVSTKLGTIANRRDTLGHTSSIDSAFKRNSLNNKVSVGIAAGISVRVSGSFYIDGRLLQNLTPYKVNTGLGNYQQRYRTIQIGVRYNIK
ncbi:outer membrane beta-barrel protein [Mucilaginibacter robiniae]|uniref:Outer membrane beta-barrel protein n=1 Tax=Mucilaginibacter robiniae TaxID=2728022 RepID=A0A7L5DXM2_9SPHI|nr:outer membrane beta-barrel protein [Mucilaginibacter robiniae]QJD95862.1 outer membrane beta-barrel protein [Mucilaginibacter robiniae]